MTDSTPATAATTTEVWARLVSIFCSECGHEEIRDASGTAAMHEHLRLIHGTVWDES